MSKYTAKSVLRSAKNLTMGYSNVQIKVREATSNEPWGPTTLLLNEIARFTNNDRDFFEIMEMLDKRLNDHGKNWRHVQKALIVLEFLLKFGSEKVVYYSRENLHVIKTLKEFQHIDERGQDQGANIRTKSREITALLNDPEKLTIERLNRPEIQQANHQEGSSMEEAELKLVLELSKKTAEEEEKKRIRTSPSKSNLSSRNLSSKNDLIDLLETSEDVKLTALNRLAHYQSANNQYCNDANNNSGYSNTGSNQMYQQFNMNHQQGFDQNQQALKFQHTTIGYNQPLQLENSYQQSDDQLDRSMQDRPNWMKTSGFQPTPFIDPFTLQSSSQISFQGVQNSSQGSFLNLDPFNNQSANNNVNNANMLVDPFEALVDPVKAQLLPPKPVKKVNPWDL